MFKLVISDDEGKTTSVPLVRDEITIGRKEGNTIRLTDRNVSRRHARLQKQNGHYVLHDLGSYNGIVINGARLNDVQALKHGDQILIGDYKLALMEEATIQVVIPPATNHTETNGKTIENLPTGRTAQTVPGIPSAMATLQGLPIASIPPPTAPVPTSTNPPAQTWERSTLSSAPPSNLPDEIRGLRLDFLSPDGVPPPVVLERLPLILGRSEACGVSLPFPSISREHARLSAQDGRLIIEDLGSQNGVLINGTKVAKGRLSPGDLVTLGVVECRIARRGDSTLLIRNDVAPPKRRPIAPLVLGVLSGGVVLGLLFTFFMVRGQSSTPAPQVVPGEELGQPATAPQSVVVTQPVPPAPNPAAPVAPGSEESPTPAVPDPSSGSENPAPTVAAGTNSRPSAAGGEIGNAPSGTVPTANAPAVAAPGNNNRPAIAQTVVNTPSAPAAMGNAPAASPSTDTAHSVTRSATNNAVAVHVQHGSEHPAHQTVRFNSVPEPVATSPTVGTTSPTPAPARPVRPASPPRERRFVASNSGSTPVPSSAGTSVGSENALEHARTLVNQGNNLGAIEVLRGHAQTEPEVGLLATTYRLAGNHSEADRTMRRYLRQFPNGPRANDFRTRLESEELP